LAEEEDRMPRTVATRIAITIVAVVFAACGRDASPTEPSELTPSSAAKFPVTVSGATIAQRPERIVSLSATATEDLFAIGAGSQVIAVDDESDYPPGVPTTRLSAYEPNVEAILSYRPDLVVTAGEPGDLGDALEAAEVPIAVMPAANDLDEAYAQILDLGLATGHVADAHDVVASIREDVTAIVASAKIPEPAPTIYHELDDTYYSVTSSTFIGQLYELLGLENIADEARGSAGNYPQLASEFIVEADPDLIFLADTECCGQTLQTVATRPGWGAMVAVRTDGVVEFLRVIADAAARDRVAA
jgi:iron complex transport system substrate-binding protein